MLTKAFAVISWHLSIHISPTQLDPAKATASPRKLNNRRRLTARKGQIPARSSTPSQFKPVSDIVILCAPKFECVKKASSSNYFWIYL